MYRAMAGGWEREKLLKESLAQRRKDAENDRFPRFKAGANQKRNFWVLW